MLVARMLDGKPEIFRSFQGEGKTTGKPSIFVRFGVCNLKCNFCDSAFIRDTMAIKMTQDEIIKAIIKIKGPYNVVFTGGEPTLYGNDILEICKKLLITDPRYTFELETNGTIKILDDLIRILHQINCSPKLASSGNDMSRYNFSAIEQLKEWKKVIFKFVIADRENDIEEIKEWQNTFKILNEKIFLMPQGVTSKEVINGSKFIVKKYCPLGYNLCTRLHVILFNKKRSI